MTRSNIAMSMIIGFFTATGAGILIFLMKLAASIAFGLGGAFGGYLFVALIKPKLDKIFKKIKR